MPLRDTQRPGCRRLPPMRAGPAVRAAEVCARRNWLAQGILEQRRDCSRFSGLNSSRDRGRGAPRADNEARSRIMVQHLPVALEF